LATEGSRASEGVGQRVLSVLVQRVQPAPWTSFGGGVVLVFPPPIDETELGEATQRAVDGDLLDAETVRHLQSVELGAALTMEALAFEQHPGVELEQEASAGAGHVTPEIVGSSPPRNR
jgi:hypothetical protein